MFNIYDVSYIVCYIGDVPTPSETWEDLTKRMRRK